MSEILPLPQLNSDASAPLYNQLKLWFIDQIRAGYWQDEALPSERLLSERLNISRATVRQAIDSLERDGWVTKHHGKGTFVAPVKVEQSLGRLRGFSENMRQAGLSPSSEVISKELIEPDEQLSKKLALNPGAVVAVITRLRLADGQALMLERSHINYSLTPKLLEHDFEQSLYDILTQTYRLHLTQGDESVEVVSATQDTAQHLGIQVDAPLLYTQRLVMNERGIPVEYAERFARADRCKFTVSFAGEQADFAVKDALTDTNST
ncbi:MAG: GntR family transcriptional regulator [Deinococcota bacterium]